MWKAGVLPLLLTLFLGRIEHADGVEQEAEGYTVTASKYDVRSSGVEDEGKGCYTNGCEPELLIDGLLNDVAESRWSCSESLTGDVVECYVTFDLGSSQTLSKLSIYFHKSEDLTRLPNPFEVSTSTTNAVYVDSFSGVNVAGTPLGVAEDFAFPANSSGRYVRLTGVLDVDQWLSINEVEVYVDTEVSVAPTPAAVNVTGTAAPTASNTVPGNTTISIAPTAAPTPVPTVVGGPACSSVTVSNAGDLSGTYDAITTAAGDLAFQSTGASAGTLAQSTTGATAVCADSSSTTPCEITEWRMRPQSANSTLPTYIVFDDAEHPSDIRELWLRLDDCDEFCTSIPVDVGILCSDGSTAGSTTPSPLPASVSDCEILEVAGTSGAGKDGLYYDDGAEPADGVKQYTGYDDVNDELVRNENLIRAKRINDTECADATSADGCSWRQWWIDSSSESGDALVYYTFDDADHPVDIASGILWYTINETVFPYDGDVVVTCAPAGTATLPGPTPAPTDGDRSVSAPDDDGWTRSPVSEGSPAPVSEDTPAPVVGGTPDEAGAEAEAGAGAGDDSGEGDETNTAVIAGSVAGAVALLAILGVAAYKLKKPPPPPPSYDDLVGA